MKRNASYHSLFFSPYLSLYRYAHSSVKMGDDIVVIGGYGSSNRSCHKRLDDVLLLSFPQGHRATKSLSIAGSGPGNVVLYTNMYCLWIIY